MSRNRTSLTAQDIFGEILAVVEKITFSKRVNGKSKLNMRHKQESRKALTRQQVLKYILFAGLIVLGSVAIWHYWRGSGPDQPGQHASPSPERPEQHSSPRPLNTDALDVLRSLPYAGSTEVEEKKASGVVFHDPKRSSPGYSLYAVHLLSMAELIDETGKVIKSWSHSTSGHWANAELLPNGDLLVGRRGARNATTRPGISSLSR